MAWECGAVERRLKRARYSVWGSGRASLVPRVTGKDRVLQSRYTASSRNSEGRKAEVCTWATPQTRLSSKRGPIANATS